MITLEEAQAYSRPFLEAARQPQRDRVAELVAEMLFALGVKPLYSTAIDDITVTCGYGHLDQYGFWEFPLHRKEMQWPRRRMAAV